MFVIMECWHNLAGDPVTAMLPLEERMGRTMRQAGVSVTVTSITDVFAFGIGACTVRLLFSQFFVMFLFVFMTDHAWVKSLLC